MGNISYQKAETSRRLPGMLVFFSVGCLFVGGLTAVRLLYEGLFPELIGLQNPVTAVLLALLIVALAAALGVRIFGLAPSLALVPLLLNLVYLINPAVVLLESRFLFLASIWAAILFLMHQQGLLKRRPLLPFIFIISFLLPVYLLTMGQAVGTADTFEFQVVIPRLGIVHPTGYPLYLLLTKLFTFFPIGSTAWRINLGTAVYALGAACFLFLFLKTLTRQRLVPVLTAVLFGLTPTFWSQAVEAEVYSLQALIAAAVLWGLSREPGSARRRLGVALLLGLGLANHLTTLIMLPAVLFYYIVGAKRDWRGVRLSDVKAMLPLAGVFLLPLTLYLYLPLRWQAVNGEPMGLERFVDWVVGGRFQGALQLAAWLNDPTRYTVVGRLFTAEWGWLHLVVALAGLVVLARRKLPVALFLTLVWLGFSFYALSYYVPDLSVFLIPAHLIIAACWGIGVSAAVQFLAAGKGPVSSFVYPVLALLLIIVFQQAVSSWAAVDASRGDGQTGWGRAVLNQPLDPQGAILADSVKFPALYYLQQAEGLRPEMDIMVLPDEAAYRAELDGRLGAGQTVYLARFLPGLAGVYHLGSVGPLTQVSTGPALSLPDSTAVIAADLTFESIKLKGYQLQKESPYAGPDSAGESAVTFYWQTAEPVEPVWQVYVRWYAPGYAGPIVSQYPVNNNYPTNAWRAGEVVTDFHRLPRPNLNQPAALVLQVALGPPFALPDSLAWQTVTTVDWQPPPALAEAADIQARLGPLVIDGLVVPEQIRPQSLLKVQLRGFGSSPDLLTLQLLPAGSYSPSPSEKKEAAVVPDNRFIWSYELAADVGPGTYLLLAEYPEQGAHCAWLAGETAGCVLAEIEVSGGPLPEGAVNFEDKIALLNVTMPDPTLRPGGELVVNLSWQGLGRMQENYTVFVQVLDGQDRIVGQVDSWPLQGTFPTSQWAVGERVEDPFVVRLSEDLPPGQYRLQVGWYLLETLRRLPRYDESGTAVDDKFVVPLG